MSSTTKEQKLQSLIEMERMLNEIQDLDVLLERILTEARKIVHADAGSIYVVEGNNLRIKYAQNDTQLKTVPAGSKIPYVSFSFPISKSAIFILTLFLPALLQKYHSLLIQAGTYIFPCLLNNA